MALGSLVTLGRRTLTGIIASGGRQFNDWSADYRLFSQERFDLDGVFDAVRNEVLDLLPAGAPVVAALDDTLLEKRGAKVPGVSYRRDPMGPPFRPNFIRAQRFIQLSMALPNGPQPSGARMIPVDFRHAPTPAKPGKNAEAERWAEYRELSKEMNLSARGIGRIRALRKGLDGSPGGAERRLITAVDGSYTNSKVLKGLPENTTLIGRIRKDAKLYHLPDESDRPARGRKPVYGKRAPTPEELRKDETVKWETVDVWAAGKVHEFHFKSIAPIRSRTAGEKHDLRLIVIRPLAYRPSKGAKLLYRKPACLICTDPNLPVEEVIQAYVWRWDIEVNIRDEKQLIGVGQAQVRNDSSVELVPAFLAASYAMLLLAGCRSYGVDGLVQGMPLPRWRDRAGKRRASTLDLISRLRAELWGKSMGVDNFSGFVKKNRTEMKPEKFHPDLPSAVLYVVA